MSPTHTGALLWQRTPKIPSDLFSLTYGSLLTELFKDSTLTISQLHTHLHRMGHNIGLRCMDEVLAKCMVHKLDVPQCRTVIDTAECIAKIGFKFYLNITCEVSNMSDTGFSLIFHDNPLSTYVELPRTEEGSSRDFSALQYSRIYCGVIDGSMESVGWRVRSEFVRDVLWGDEENEVRVDVVGREDVEIGEEYQDSD